MKRALMLASACLFLVSLNGCTSDPRDAEIKKVIAFLEEAGNDVRSIADGVQEAVKKAKADPEKKIVTKDELKTAFEAIDRLKVLGNKLQYVKAKIDSFADLPSEDQKKTYVKENKADIESKLDRLSAEERNLEVVLKDASPLIHRDAMTDLREKLKDAEERYLTLGQRQ